MSEGTPLTLPGGAAPPVRIVIPSPSILLRTGSARNLVNRGGVASVRFARPLAARGVTNAVLADRTLHLQLDEAVELDGVLHRQLLDDRLDQAADDHLSRPPPVDAPAPAGRRAAPRPPCSRSLRAGSSPAPRRSPSPGRCRSASRRRAATRRSGRSISRSWRRGRPSAGRGSWCGRRPC